MEYLTKEMRKINKMETNLLKVVFLLVAIFMVPVCIAAESDQGNQLMCKA